MSQNDKTHHPQQSPVHDENEAKPGLDSLAPDDGSHLASPVPTPPGQEPTAPGSLKAPHTGNEKLNALEAVRKGGENFPLTTNQGVRIADDQKLAARRDARPDPAGRFHPAGENHPFRP